MISTVVEGAVTNPTRISGATRYETSYRVATELKGESNRTFLATGTGFADALTGSVLAAKQGANVLLVRPVSLTEEQAAYVDGNTVTILGGKAAIADGLVENETNPTYDAMNLLGYDAATFGNHEFNYGLDFLEGSIKG